MAHDSYSKKPSEKSSGGKMANCCTPTECLKDKIHSADGPTDLELIQKHGSPAKRDKQIS